MCPYHWSQVPLIYLFSSTLRFSVGGVIACHRWVYWRPHLIETPQQYSIPVYSGKQIVSGDFLIFSSNKSFLFRKRIMDVSVNHLLLQIESNSFKLSCIRFWKKKGFLFILIEKFLVLQIHESLHMNTMSMPYNVQ